MLLMFSALDPLESNSLVEFVWTVGVAILIGLPITVVEGMVVVVDWLKSNFVSSSASSQPKNNREQRGIRIFSIEDSFLFMGLLSVPEGETKETELICQKKIRSNDELDFLHKLHPV